MNAAAQAPSRQSSLSQGQKEVKWQDLSQPQRQTGAPAARGRGNRPAPSADQSARAPAAVQRSKGPARAVSAPDRAAFPATAAKFEPEKAEHAILFQKYFKSVGKRTYVAQLKVASNGNHYLVLTEASRVKGTDDIRKTRVFIYSEDFKAFFDLLADSQRFITANPVPADIAQERASFWRKVNSGRSKIPPK